MSLRAAAWSAAVLLALHLNAQQQFPTLERGFRPEKLYQFSDIDSVNAFNGTLLINLPVGPDYRLDGGMSYGLRLSFNSKPWDLLQVGNLVHATPSQRANAGFGWIIGFGRFVPSDDPANNLSGIDLYEAPDGGDHFFDGVSADNCTSSCPSYTSDGSNLRLRTVSSTIREIDFPDGVTKRFIKSFLGVWELRQIRTAASSDAVTITRGAGTSAGCAAGTDSHWIVGDSRGRSYKVCFDNRLVNSVSRPMVDRVVFSSPGGTATYSFVYQPMTLSKPPEDTDHDGSTWRQTHDVQLLSGITLPDGSSYSFAVGGGGVIGTMTLPTLGKISYQYGGWLVPSTSICSNTYGVGFGFGGYGSGVEVRTYTPAVPAGQTPVDRTWIYERQLRSQNGTVGYQSAMTCTVDGGPGNPPIQTHVELWDELVVTITDPLDHQTVSHFSVWPGGDAGRLPDPDTSPAGFRRIHYNYPHGRYDAAQDRYLSQELFDCAGTCALKRSVWVRQEPEPRSFDPDHNDPPVPNRMVSQSTVFHDDPAGCVAEGAAANCARTSADYDDWDGYGHHRQSSTTVQFHDDEEVRTVVTAWNKVAGVPRTITKNDPWLLNTYESVSTTENGVTAVEQTCFDLTDGFMRGHRKLGGTSPASTDLVVLYGNENLNGNTTSEKYFGGDVSPMSANQAVLCSALDALDGVAPESQINHEWQNAHLVTSQDDSMPFFSRDLTVDLHGLVTSSRDPNGLETTYAYDSNWRLVSVTPPGQPATTYTYTNASGSGTSLTQPAAVVETTQSAVAGLLKREYQYDAFGRLWRQKRLMTDGHWSLAETLYDELGRRASLSEAASLQGQANELAFVPPHKTSFLYERFGRPATVTRPDGTSTSTTYSGTRTSMRTYSIAAGGASETAVGTRDEYDALGRLVAVTENVDLVPGDGIQGEVTTGYGYDIGGRLSSVSMAGAAGTQERTFTYDKRGLLITEKHPEVGVSGNGTTTYALHDARGRAGRKVVGSTIDLRYVYDKAGRLIQIKDGKQGNRDLELFSFDCIRFVVTEPCASVTHRGQLAASARYNYDPELGTIAVTEGLTYDAVTGHLVRRDSAVGDGVVAGVTRFTGESFFFFQGHNDVGLLQTLSYPCLSSGCSGSAAGEIQHTYANGELKSVGSWASSITYRPNGTIDTITHGVGASASLEKWEADPHGMARPGRIYSTNASNTQELWSSGSYEYDGSGNVKKVGNTSYTYDPFGRLTAWTTTAPSGPGGGYTSTRRGYDEFGNYTYTFHEACGPTPNPLCHSTSYLPLQMRGTTNHYLDLSYDGAGNVLLDRDQNIYTWDPLGMMTSATTNGRTFRYLYDAHNERIAAVERVQAGAQLRNRTTFTLRGDGHQLLSTFTDDWTTGSRVFARKEDTIWRGSQVLAAAKPSTAMNYALDHLGSPRLITNAAGTVLDTQTFEPFGSGGLFGSGPLQFTAHERDQANLGGGTFLLPDYMHARYYSPWAGRFLSVDPALDVETAMQSPQTWNRYAYVANNPTNSIDPTGAILISVTGQSTVLDIAGDAASRVSFNANGTINTSGFTADDLANNEGARLLHSMAISNNVYTYEEGNTSPTAGGTQQVNGVLNLDDNPADIILPGGNAMPKASGRFPVAGVNGAITVDPAIQYFDAATGTKAVPTRAIAFHELAESYAKVEQNIVRGPDNGPGAHYTARLREAILMLQRPNWTPYPAGGRVKK